MLGGWHPGASGAPGRVGYASGRNEYTTTHPEQQFVHQAQSEILADFVLRVVCSLSAGGFSYRLHICGGFWFPVFRPGVSFVVSTHSTDVISLHSFPEVMHGQGQRILAGETSRWTVVGGFQLHTYR